MQRICLLATLGLLANVAVADPVVMQKNLQQIMNDQFAVIDRDIELKIDALVEQTALNGRSEPLNLLRAVSDERIPAARQLLHLELHLEAS
jgi:hypothetical protein